MALVLPSKSSKCKGKGGYVTATTIHATAYDKDGNVLTSQIYTSAKTCGCSNVWEFITHCGSPPFDYYMNISVAVDMSGRWTGTVGDPCTLCYTFDGSNKDHLPITSWGAGGYVAITW